MTLDEAKELLNTNNIPYELRKFENGAEYWRHTTLFPCTENFDPCRVAAMVIRSNNAKKDIELHFNAIDDCFCFVDLRLRDFSYEMFDRKDELQAEDLLQNIFEIIQGNVAVIVWNDLKKRRFLGDACFDLNDDGVFGKTGFKSAIQKIRAPRLFLKNPKKEKTQYEIYDWNTYECIIRIGLAAIGVNISMLLADCSVAVRIKKNKGLILKRHLSCILHGKIFPMANCLISVTK